MGRNPFLLDGDVGFHVETEIGSNGYNCTYIITENFAGDYPYVNIRGGRVYRFKIRVVVDLCAKNSNPLKEYLFFEIPELDGLRRRSNDPRDFLTGYPFNILSGWKNNDGERLIEWANRLGYSRYLRPSHQDCNGGKSPHRVDRERFAREIREIRKARRSP